MRAAGATSAGELGAAGARASLAERLGAKLIDEEKLFPKLGGLRLRHELDQHLWQGRDHVGADELAGWFAQYLYLPRLTAPKVLAEAIAEGAAHPDAKATFVLARSYDEAQQRYRGLYLREGRTAELARKRLSLSSESSSLLVKPELALAQTGSPSEAPGELSELSGQSSEGLAGQEALGSDPAASRRSSLPPRLFVAHKKLSTMRMGGEASRVAEEIVRHLEDLAGSELEVTLEVRARVPQGLPKEVVSVLRENCAALRFEPPVFAKDGAGAKDARPQAARSESDAFSVV